MALVLPEVESFGTQFAKALGSSAGQGFGNTPNMLMDLLKQKRDRQAQFGQMAVDLASKIDPDMGVEDIAEIYEKGSKMEAPNKNPAEIMKQQTKEAVERKNKQSRVKENIEPERVWKRFTDPFTGESPEDRARKGEKLGKQLKDFSKPKQRQLLSKKLAPEEIEERVSPLSKETLESINSFPNLKSTQAKKNVTFGETPEIDLETAELTDPQRDFFEKSLADVFKKNPNANPLLVRKQFEDLGVSWREYRDAIERLQEKGELDLSQNEDYPYLENYLYKPPLGPMNKILHNLKLIGR